MDPVIVTLVATVGIAAIYGVWALVKAYVDGVDKRLTHLEAGQIEILKLLSEIQATLAGIIAGKVGYMTQAGCVQQHQINDEKIDRKFDALKFDIREDIVALHNRIDRLEK